MTVGERIWLYRTHLGMTQKDLEEKSGVSCGVVGQWESGKRVPRAASARKIAKVLGTTARMILKGE